MGLSAGLICLNICAISPRSTRTIYWSDLIITSLAYVTAIYRIISWSLCVQAYPLCHCYLLGSSVEPYIASFVLGYHHLSVSSTLAIYRTIFAISSPSMEYSSTICAMSLSSIGKFYRFSYPSISVKSLPSTGGICPASCILDFVLAAISSNFAITFQLLDLSDI